MDQIRHFYDVIAQDSANKWYEYPALQTTIDEFISILPRNPSVLDLGCGAGYESMRLSRAGARVTGVDFSKKSLSIAIERNPECEFHLLDFRNINRDLGNFDGVFASGSLIHLSPSDLAQTTRRIHPILNDGGLFLAILRHGVGYSESFTKVYDKELLGSHYGYDIASLRKIFESCDYQFYGESLLVDELRMNGWFCAIFRKV